jgi:hypothetical protein
MPLILIPFGGAIGQLVQLSRRYRFSCWNDIEVLQCCDDLSTRWKGRVHGHFRKLAIWEGPFDEFIYIDVDTVVLEDMSFVFPLLSDYDVLTAHSNIATSRQWVWKESIVGSGLLTREQIAYSANTGFIASKRKVVTLELASAKLRAANQLRAHMADGVIDQPFLNFLIVTSATSYSSLYSIFLKDRATLFPLERWGGRDLGAVEQGRLLDSRFTHTLFVHWAGEWRAAQSESRQIHNFKLWEFYRQMMNE